MFEVVYSLFFVLMIFQVLLFVFLNLPFPKHWKGGIFKRIYNSPSIRTFLKIQVLLCVMAGVFYADLSKQERKYLSQKNKLRLKNSMGAELRKSTLSYQIMKIHRNKYISFLVIFTFLTTVVFFWIKERRYEMEELYKEELSRLETASRQHNEPEAVFFD